MVRNNLHFRVSCTGSNLSILLSKIINKGLILKDIKREDNKIEFSLSELHYNIFKKMELSQYKIELIKMGGKHYLKNYIISKLGLIIGLIISIIGYAFLSNRLFYINVIGANTIDKEIIINSLKEIGVKEFSIIPSDTDYIEEYLSKEFDFSLVSVITKGNSITINVKEELSQISEGYQEIVAEYDMVIESIDVYSGTSSLKSGDIVKKGQVIVYPFNYIGEEKVSVQPKAKLTATRFVSKTQTFYSSEEIMIRTGDRKVVSCEYYLGNNKIYSMSKNIEFENYELEENNILVSEYFLPISIKNVTVYELEKQTITRDFESEKFAILEKLKSDCYNECEDNEIVSENENIVEMSYGYVINYHVGVKVYLDY